MAINHPGFAPCQIKPDFILLSALVLTAGQSVKDFGRVANFFKALAAPI